MKKRVLSALLILCMMLTLLPTIAFAADTVAYAVTGGNIYFDPATGEITDCDYDVTEAVIPSEIEGVPVTGISGYAFSFGKLTSVTIPDSVITIGECAFQGCDLTSVVIPDSVTIIGNSAFHSCSLTSLSIGNNVTSIGDAAFLLCDNLTNVTIPDSVITIGKSAFSECYKLSNLSIGNGVVTIGDYAFSQCSALTNVTIPASVTSVGKYVFDMCTSLTEITVDDSNLYYSSKNGILFDKAQTILLQYPIGKTNASYTVPDGVATVGAGAFAGCNNLTSVIISDTVTTIEASAFNECF